MGIVSSVLCLMCMRRHGHCKECIMVIVNHWKKDHPTQ